MSLARVCRFVLQSVPKSPLLWQDLRPLTRIHFRQQSTSAEAKKLHYDETPTERFLNKVPFMKMRKTKLTVTAYLLYENIADKINYVDFFDTLALPDTFYSWFVITELHIWMLSVRLMAEGEDGRVVRNGMLEALWNDVPTRVKHLGAYSSSTAKTQIVELGQQLHAALVFYDGGLYSDDSVLAGALWRRFYQDEDAELAHLELLVKYVRKQIHLLDQVSDDQIFRKRTIGWEPLKS